MAQDAHVLPKAAEEASGPAVGIPGEREPGGQFPGPDLQRLQSEELASKGASRSRSDVFGRQFL
jgi:hypothetical protein